MVCRYLVSTPGISKAYLERCIWKGQYEPQSNEEQNVLVHLKEEVTYANEYTKLSSLIAGQLALTQPSLKHVMQLSILVLSAKTCYDYALLV